MNVMDDSGEPPSVDAEVWQAFLDNYAQQSRADKIEKIKTAVYVGGTVMLAIGAQIIGILPTPQGI